MKLRIILHLGSLGLYLSTQQVGTSTDYKNQFVSNTDNFKYYSQVREGISRLLYMEEIFWYVYHHYVPRQTVFINLAAPPIFENIFSWFRFFLRRKNGP